MMQSANRAFGTDERGKMRTCRYVDRTTTLELLPLLAFRRTATVHRGARPRFAPSHAQGWPCWLSTTTDALRPLKAEVYCKGRSRRHVIVMCPRCQPRSRSLSFSQLCCSLRNCYYSVTLTKWAFYHHIIVKL